LHGEYNILHFKRFGGGEGCFPECGGDYGLLPKPKDESRDPSGAYSECHRVDHHGPWHSERGSPPPARCAIVCCCCCEERGVGRPATPPRIVCLGSAQRPRGSIPPSLPPSLLPKIWQTSSAHLIHLNYHHTLTPPSQTKPLPLCPRKLLPWSSTMGRVCARPALPVTMPRER
jgi:hypothetical protein